MRKTKAIFQRLVMESVIRFNSFILLFLIFLSFPGRAYPQPIPENVHRVLFLGNSITYSGAYIAYIETYYRVHYPYRNIEFLNLGLPSETVSGLSEPGHAEGRFPRPDLHERLERVLAAAKPDMVFACYGMNDGIYMPLNDERFNKFKDGITWLYKNLTDAGIKTVLLTPPVYDEKMGKQKGYSAVLDRYSDWINEQSKNANWDVIDIHYPMKQFLEAKRKQDSTFAFAADGVHPSETGHWIIAKEILLHLGEKLSADDTALINLTYKEEYIFKLVKEKQAILKDAWLTASKHTRPGMPPGLPLDEAYKKGAEIDNYIFNLIR